MFINYIIKNGESIDDISRKFNVSSKEIININNIKNKDLINVKQVRIPIKNPNFNYYESKSGDTLYKIAKRNNVDLELLALVNGMKVYDYLYPNQIILVPKKGIKFYMIKDSESLQDISYKTKNTIESLLFLNPNLYLLQEQLIAYKD